MQLRPISRVAFSPAIRFAHKLSKKQSRLLASQFYNWEASAMAEILPQLVYI